MHRLILPLLLLIAGRAVAMEPPLRICATVPDLGDLARAVGGDAVIVTVFARGGDDPHFVDPRPGFAKVLASADLVASIGLELEVGWLPVVVAQARNPRLSPGRPGWFEAAAAVALLGIPVAPVDRAQGDVHPGGNPHFLGDPVRGVQVARALARRLGELRPAQADLFAQRWRACAAEIARRLVGDAAVERVGTDRAADALGDGDPAPLIGDDLGGWLARLRPAAGARLIADHDLWPYFTQRFGLEVVGFLEPKPGVPPTTRHLAGIVALAAARDARAIVTTPYFDPRHAAAVAARTGLPIIALAHQAGAFPDAPTWTAAIERNVEAIAAILAPR